MREAFRYSRWWMLAGGVICAFGLTGAVAFMVSPTPESPPSAYLLGLNVLVWAGAVIAAFGAYAIILFARWEVTVDELELTWTDCLLRRHKMSLSDIRGLGLLRFGQREHSIYVVGATTIVIGAAHVNADRLIEVLTEAVGLRMGRTRQVGKESETYWIKRNEDLEYVTGQMLARIRRTRLILSGVVAVVFGGMIAGWYLASAPAWYLAFYVAMAVVMCTWLVVITVRRR
jgi:membrane protein YdbS with pleckstrin-like domain